MTFTGEMVAEIQEAVRIRTKKFEKEYERFGFEKPGYSVNFSGEFRMSVQDIEGNFSKIIEKVPELMGEQSEHILENINVFQGWVNNWAKDGIQCKLKVRGGYQHQQLVLYDYLSFDMYPLEKESDKTEEDYLRAEQIMKQHFTEEENTAFDLAHLFDGGLRNRTKERRKQILEITTNFEGRLTPLFEQINKYFKQLSEKTANEIELEVQHIQKKYN